MGGSLNCSAPYCEQGRVVCQGKKKGPRLDERCEEEGN